MTSPSRAANPKDMGAPSNVRAVRFIKGSFRRQKELHDYLESMNRSGEEDRAWIMRNKVN